MVFCWVYLQKLLQLLPGFRKQKDACCQGPRGWIYMCVFSYSYWVLLLCSVIWFMGFLLTLIDYSRVNGSNWLFLVCSKKTYIIYRIDWRLTKVSLMVFLEHVPHIHLIIYIHIQITIHLCMWYQLRVNLISFVVVLGIWSTHIEGRYIIRSFFKLLIVSGPANVEYK